MTRQGPFRFIDNPAAKARPEAFLEIEIRIDAVLQSWKSSLYSFEWLKADGTIKSLAELEPGEAAKRAAIENAVKQETPLEKPLLGIGVFDNVEIGSGRAQLLTLADMGLKTMPVHIPKSNAKDFQRFLAKDL